MDQIKLNPLGLGIAIAGMWGISILAIGLLAHFTGWGTQFIESVDNLYPGSGTGLRGTLIALIFGIIHGLVTGALIAWLYNAYLTTQLD